MSISCMTFHAVREWMCGLSGKRLIWALVTHARMYSPGRLWKFLKVSWIWSGLLLVM